MRHQLPVYSPISFNTVATAFASSIGLSHDSRGELATAIRREYSADSVVLCGSGTQSLQVAIVAARRMIGLDAIVALPAFTCFDVASAALGAGGPVVLYDVNPASLAPDIHSIERTLAHGARVVVVAPLYGIPVDWARIEQIASSHGAMLIEDAAQGVGASYDDKPLGALGDISTLSFGRGKGWTGGSGGAVLFRGGKTPAPELADANISSSVVSAVALAAQWSLGRPAIYGIPSVLPGLALGETVYHAPRTPSVMSESAAAAIRNGQEAAIRESETRRTNALWIREQLASQQALREVKSEANDSVSGYLRFPVLASRGIQGFGSNPRALGIAPSYPIPIAELSPLSGSIVGNRQFPGAKQLAAELVTLPVHSLLSSSDRMLLARRIREYSDA